MGQKNSRSNEPHSDIYTSLHAALDELAAFDEDIATDMRKILHAKLPRSPVLSKNSIGNSRHTKYFKLRIQLSYLQDHIPGVRKCREATHKILIYLTSRYPFNYQDTWLNGLDRHFPVIRLSNGHVYRKEELNKALRGDGRMPDLQNISEYDIALIQSESRNYTIKNGLAGAFAAFMIAMFVASFFTGVGLGLGLLLGVPAAIALLSGVISANSYSENRSDQLQPNFRSADLSTYSIFGTLESRPSSTINFEEHALDARRRTFTDDDASTHALEPTLQNESHLPSLLMHV